ncbi:MAG: phosphoglycerol transferase [Arcobacter sp.]|nr:MAG: phosphoglycerol transferase [Arcobacter sp.]
MCEKVPRLLRFLFTIVLFMTLVFVLLHLAFWMVFEDPAAPLSSADFWKSLWIGSRFDLRIAIIMILPIFFTGWIKWFNPFYSKYHKYFWLSYLTLFFSVIAMFYIIDFGHYGYLGLRLDVSALRFLQDFAISADMVMESYPVFWITLAYLASIGIFIFLINGLYERCKAQPTPSYGYMKTFLIGFIALFLVVFGFMSKLSQYPLRWSEAAFSSHPFAAQFTYNPVQYFFDTRKNGGISFDKDEVIASYEIMADFLGVKDKNVSSLNYQRNALPMFERQTQPNVVIVIVESFATYKTSVDGNAMNPTPIFKALADEGYYFKNFFTPSTGTARSIFTTITSMPDIGKKGTSSRNPLIVNQHSIANEFKGYDKSYFIGGSASWGNIRGILTKNMDDLRVYEEPDYAASRNDVWGVSDIDLFIEANEVLKQKKGPFISFIQTSGNHRPYTIPDETYGFELSDTKDELVKKHGFESNEEYNAYRLMDYSIGYFIDLAKKAGYAKDTIFVFWGDHGLNGTPGPEALKADGHSELNLGSHRVPFVIWAPGLIKEPKIFDKVISEVDVMASIASFAGISYRSTALGRDIFDPAYDKSEYAFTVLHTTPLEIGLVSDKFWYKMKENAKEGSLYSLQSQTPRVDISSENEIEAKKMHDLTQAIYKTLEYMVYHNQREHLRD